MLCTERSLVKHDGSLTVVSPLRCKCWHCQHCAPIRKRDLYWDARRGEPRIFLTLTMRKGRFSTPDEQAQEFVKGWRMLRQFLCRHLKRKSIPFIAIFEKHESGWPHLHILLRGGYIDHRLIRRWWEHRFNSFKIDVRLAKGPHQSAAYVTKYVSGDPFKFDGVKRYWRSQDWLPPKAEDEKPVLDEYTWWEVENCRPYVMAIAAMESGARVTFRHPKIIIENWDAVSRERWGLG